MEIFLKVGCDNWIGGKMAAFYFQKKESILNKRNKVRGEDPFHEFRRERMSQAEESLSILFILVEIGSVKLKYLFELGEV